MADNTFAKGEFPDEVWPLKECPPVCRIPVFHLQPLVQGCPQSSAPRTTTSASPPFKALTSWLLGLFAQFPFNLKWIFPILEGQVSAQMPFPLWSMPCNSFLASEAEFLSLLTFERSSVVPFLFLQHCWAIPAIEVGNSLPLHPKVFLHLELARSFGWELGTLGRECYFVFPSFHCWGILKWLN